MTEREAAKLLADQELVPALQGSLAEIKRLKAACLEADIAVAVISPPGKS